MRLLKQMIRTGVAVAALLTVAASAAFAQGVTSAALTGVVKDDQGGVDHHRGAHDGSQGKHTSRGSPPPASHGPGFHRWRDVHAPPSWGRRENFMTAFFSIF